MPTTDLLAGPADLAARLEDRTASDPIVLDALRRLSARFRGATGNHITTVTDETIELSGTGSTALQLFAAPVTAITEITINGEPITDYQVGKKAGILRRAGGWPDGLDNISITYSHGHTEVPADIQDAVLEMAEAFCNMSAGIDSVTTGDESIKMAASLINGGSLGTWADMVTKYTLGGNSDRS